MSRYLLISCTQILLVLISSLKAQKVEPRPFSRTEGKGFGLEAVRGLHDRPNSSEGVGQLLSYQLDLDFTEGLLNNSPLYFGRERITWEPNGDGLIILAAAEGLRIDSVISAGQRLTLSPPEEPGMVIIELPVALRDQDSLLVDIWYAHTSTVNKGYYYYDKNTSGSQNQWTLERVGYTFTEPYDSPYWFPCINDPSVKVPCWINMTVPGGYLAASNGLLKQTMHNGDGTVTFQWEERHPIAMYLMAVAISKYSTFSHYYHRVSKPLDSVEIKYYVWQADSAGTTYNAVTSFANVVDMMTFYSTVFGKYPFDKYGMAAVYPFGAGGMEHQTMTTIHRSWLENGGSQGGIAHELAHQWWGDMVTCGTFADIWLNEGFATYSEALWEEHFYGSARFSSLMSGIQHFTNGSWQVPIYDPPENYLFGDVEYSKGAWVLHMLRGLLGDSAFFNVFKTYRQRFEYKSATTDDFAAATSSVAGRDLSWFFNQWIYAKGWPIYAYRWTAQSGGGGYDVKVDIQQQQDEDVFQMPVQLKLQGGGRDTLVVADNTMRNQSFSFVIPFRPDTVYFDPGEWILKQLSSIFLSDPGTDNGLPHSFVLYQNYPNPFNLATVIRYYLPATGIVGLKVYDLLGREVVALVNEEELAGFHEFSFDAERLTSGVYFYSLRVTSATETTSAFVDTKKMLLLK
jgi:aminopeptidase N